MGSFLKREEVERFLWSWRNHAVWFAPTKEWRAQSKERVQPFVEALKRMGATVIPLASGAEQLARMLIQKFSREEDLDSYSEEEFRKLCSKEPIHFHGTMLPVADLMEHYWVDLGALRIPHMGGEFYCTEDLEVALDYSLQRGSHTFLEELGLDSEYANTGVLLQFRLSALGRWNRLLQDFMPEAMRGSMNYLLWKGGTCSLLPPPPGSMVPKLAIAYPAD